MKKQTLFLIIGTAVMLVLGIVLVITVNAKTTDDPLDLLFGETVELRNETPVEDNPGGPRFSYIKSHAAAYNEDNQRVGDVYDVVIRNQYALDVTAHYGEIELLVGIDGDDKVFVSIVSLDQSTWTAMGIQAYILESFDGIDYQDVELIPEWDAANPTAGATATDSTGTIKETVLKVVNLHYGVITDLTPIRLARYQALLANTASFVELDLSTDPTSIMIKAELHDVDDVIIGYAIEASTSNNFGLLHVVIVTDTTGEIIAAEFVDYGNSYFETDITSALNDLVGETLSDVSTDGFALAAPSSTDTVPSMEYLIDDISSAYDHILNGGA